ncbi:MAG: hypothetical protein QF773_04860 [Lentisphaeria bacterium]|nr:hypothetical protein [Lentisphaeria bacterium]
MMIRNTIKLFLLALMVFPVSIMFAEVASEEGGGDLNTEPDPPGVPPVFTATDLFIEQTPLPTVKPGVDTAVSDQFIGERDVNRQLLDDSKAEINTERLKINFAEGRNKGLKTTLTNLAVRLQNLEQLIEMNKGILEDATDDQDAVVEQIMEVRDAIRTVEIVDALVQTAKQNTAQSATSRGLNAVRRSSTSHTKAPGGAFGENFTNLSLSTSASFSSFSDAGGSGHDRENSFFLDGTFADTFDFGLGANYSEYKVGGEVDMRRRTVVYDFYANYTVTDKLTIGAFLNYSQIDVEDAIVTILGVPENLAQNVDRLGAGMLASTSTEVDDIDIGLTTSLASFNKRSFTRLLDNEDASWATMVDANKSWTDEFSTFAYATFYTMLDNEEEDVDSTFWIVGLDGSYAPKDWMDVSIGYEKTLKYHQLKDHRVNASLNFYF